MCIEADTDHFLDFLNEIKSKGFTYEVITRERYFYLKDELELPGFQPN